MAGNHGKNRRRITMTIKELLTNLKIAETDHAEAEKAVKDFLDGAYVPKTRFNEVNEKSKLFEKQVSERDSQLKDLKKNVGDNEALKAQIEQLQKTNKEQKDASEKAMHDLRMNTAIKLAIGDKAQDSEIVAGLIDKDKIILSEDGKVTGLNEQLANLQKDKAFLFKAVEPPNYTPNGGGSPQIKNPFAKETFNLTAQGQMLKTNPEQARALASAAGIKF